MERMNAASFAALRRARPDLVPGPDRSRILRFSAALSMPIQVQASVRLSECDRPNGSKVTLNGAVVLAGLGAALRFGRGDRFGDERFSLDSMLIPPGEWFVVAASARAPILNHAPFRIHFHDGDGMRLSDAYDLGPCGEEPRGFALSFHAPIAVTVEITTDSLGPGSRPTIGGTLVFLRGILARCTYPAHGTALDDGDSLAAAAEAVAIPVGQTIRFPEQLLSSTAPTSHLRALSFLDGHGHQLGRYVPRLRAGNGKLERGGGSI